MNEILIFLSIIIFLIICSGFFSSSETALTAVSEARINELVTQGSKRAKLIDCCIKAFFFLPFNEVILLINP